MVERDDALLKVLEARSFAELAIDLGISIQAVWQWRRVPVGRVLDVERVTKIKRYKIRPDVYPPPRAKPGTQELRFEIRP